MSNINHPIRDHLSLYVDMYQAHISISGTLKTPLLDHSIIRMMIITMFRHKLNINYWLTLHLNLTNSIQCSQTTSSVVTCPHISAIRALDDPRLRIILAYSMKDVIQKLRNQYVHCIVGGFKIFKIFK